MTKQVEAIVREAVESLKGGRTLDSILGRVAYDHGKSVRDAVAAELVKCTITGYYATR